MQPFTVLQTLKQTEKVFAGWFFVLFLLSGMATESLSPSVRELTRHLICPGSPPGCQTPP